MGLLQFLALPGQYLGREHDDIQYVLAARSLLEGRYALGVSPGDGPLTFVTPGWPALLLPAALLSGDRALGYELWSWLWLLLCDVLFWLWIKRRLEGASAYLVLALFALNPLTLSRCGVVMSEVPFLACALGLLLLLDRPGGLAPIWAGLGLGACGLIRPGAAALAPALLGAYAVSGRWRQAAAAAGAALAPALAWKAWVASRGAELAEQAELSAHYAGRGLGGLLEVAAHNSRACASLLGQTLLPSNAPAALCLALGASLGAAVVWSLWRRRALPFEPAAAYLAGGALLHAFWPWWYERYLLPFLPFFFWALAAGMTGGLSLARAALLTCLALSSFMGSFQVLRRAAPLPELRAAYEWVRAHTREQDLFASAFYCRDAWYTGRPFLPLPPRGEAAAWLRARRAGFVLWQRPPDLGSSFGESFLWAGHLRDLERTLDSGDFERVYADEESGARVYRVRSAVRH